MNSVSPPRQHDGRSNMATVCTGRSGRETAFKYEKSLMCDDELDGDFVLLFFFILCILMLHPSFLRRAAHI